MQPSGGGGGGGDAVASAPRYRAGRAACGVRTHSVSVCPQLLLKHLRTSERVVRPACIVAHGAPVPVRLAPVVARGGGDPS